MNTLQKLWAMFIVLWNTGNRIARAAILLIVLWPVLVGVVALMGSPTITSIVALMPIAAIAFSIVAALDPIVIAVVAAFKKGRTVLTWIATIIAAELVLGVYFSIVPVWNDRGLVPVVVLVAVAIFFLAVGTKGKIQKTAISAMTLIIIILTIIFFLGGRDKAAGKLEPKPPAEKIAGAPTATEVATYPLCADGEYDFSNLDIKKVGKVEFPVSRHDCWIKVTLPSKDCVTHDSTVEVKRVWDDGVADVEGPNRINKSRTGNIIFVKSLQGEGVYKILARTRK
jgi:hypothetical protein